MFQEFAGCFHDADAVIVADVYEAGEQPIEGIDKTLTLAAKFASAAIGWSCRFQPRGITVDHSRHRQARRHGCLPRRRKYNPWAASLPEELTKLRYGGKEEPEP